jgi:predicted metalloprotease
VAGVAHWGAANTGIGCPFSDREVSVRRLAVLFVAALSVTALAAPAAIAQSNGGNDEPTLDDSGDGKAKRTADYRDTLKDAIVDIQEYWTDEFPELYGTDYEPIPRERIIAAKPGVKLPKCQGTTVTYADAQGNAFYCYRSNFIAYDDVGLFPSLHEQFGGLAVPLVLAHEWGHAIEDRAGNAGERVILKELQADCFAGAWLKHVADGDSARIELADGNLDAALAALLNFADEPGTSEENTPQAHGSGFDRVSALQQGFDAGAEACAPYYETPPVIVEIPFSDEQDAASGGNAPAEKVIPVAVDLLNDYYTQVEPAYVPKTVGDIYAFDADDEDDLPVCGGTEQDKETVDNRLFYCIDDGNFGFDEPYVQHIYDDIGDFGVVTLFSNPFATYVQTIQQFPGADTNADNAVLGADCYGGGFAAAMFNELLSSDELSETGETETIVLSPGDLDETIQALIDYTSARKVDANLDVTFLRVRAFRDGFFNGYAGCAAYRDGTASFG